MKKTLHFHDWLWTCALRLKTLRFLSNLTTDLLGHSAGYWQIILCSPPQAAMAGICDAPYPGMLAKGKGRRRNSTRVVADQAFYV